MSPPSALINPHILLFSELNGVQSKPPCASVVKPAKKWTIVWRNVALLLVLHLIAVPGWYLWLFRSSWRTYFYTLFVGLMGGYGITAGAHRLWAHRAYKAKLPLRILLTFFNTIALQTPIYDWVRDHRIHHKHTDTDADPHNAQRGFFFSHMGWLLIRKHSSVIEQGRKLDLSDLEQDGVVMFQKRYYHLMGPVLCFVVPALVPWWCWNEDWTVSWMACVFRYVISLHCTWSVNSFAHFFGSKPYDRNIKPTENVIVAIFAFGEGWHNYHHVFPWDYKTSEWGAYWTNISLGFIDLMARIGWAYDLKSVSKELIAKRCTRTGDGSHGGGWSDELLADEERDIVEISYRLHRQ